MNKQTMIDHLNEDLAGELGAIIQYITYAAKATGPYRPQLAQFFLTEVADEQLHAQYLANKIVALGGEPTTQPRSVPAAHNNREMLQAILAAERQATQDYSKRAKEADEFGDKGMAVQLEDMIRDESGHSEETERMLALLESLKEGHAIALVEHDMDAVFRVADRITVMVNGSVLACDTPEAVRADPQVQAAYLGHDA